ncbi:MAG: hypothetical protein ACTSRU_19165 [Candidatus Hodarchaeales archaeon]
MASLNNIHTALLVKMAALFPNKTQMNANDMEDSPIQFLEDGWGIKVGGGTPIDNEHPNKDYVFATDRTISIVFSREVYDLQASLTSYNTQVGAIADDKDSLLSSMLDFNKVTGMLGGENLLYSGDGGIEFLVSGKKRFIYMEIVFSFDLTQLINQ